MFSDSTIAAIAAITAITTDTADTADTACTAAAFVRMQHDKFPVRFCGAGDTWWHTTSGMQCAVYSTAAAAAKRAIDASGRHWCLAWNRHPEWLHVWRVGCSLRQVHSDVFRLVIAGVACECVDRRTDSSAHDSDAY